MTRSVDTKAAVIVQEFRMLLRPVAITLCLSAVLCGQAQETGSVQVAIPASNNTVAEC